METTRYKIPAGNLPALEAKIAKLAQRAVRVAKKGNLVDSAPIAIEVGEKVFETDEVTGNRQMFFMVSVTGSSPQLAGWQFIATLQHEEAGTILRSVPTASFPEGTLARFRAALPVCEHCNYNRRRNDTFVVRHSDGTVKQVGRNCLAAFTGCESPEALAAMAELLALAGEIAEMYENGGGGRGEITEDIEDYLGYVVCSIRESGWLSRTKARDQGGIATADLAWAGMHPTPFQPYKMVPTDADRAQAAAAFAWADNHLTEAASETLTDYEHNLRVAVAGGRVTSRLAGILGSVVGYYERAQSDILRKQVAEATKVRGNMAGYVGSPKKRETFRVTLVAVYDYTTQYGVTHAHKFITQDEGAVVMWKTGSDKLELGEYSLVGTVKEHSEYKGELQTVVTRCKAERVNAVAA